MSKIKEIIARFLSPVFVRFLGHTLRRPSITAPSFAPNERPYRVT